MVLKGARSPITEGKIIILLLLLLLPAYFLNYGLTPLVQDEPIRALVTKEMQISGNYIVPTTNGESYYNKPPLYNWIIAATLKIAPHENEFWFRFPSIVAYLIFSFLIFLFAAPHLGRTAAMYAAFFNLTYGAWLFYGSLLGYIDNVFSLVVFAAIISIYHGIHNHNYKYLFYFSYLLTAIGFLCKGMPAIVFQGLTLMSALIMERKWKMLFSIQHLAGIVLFILLTGSYYYLYAQQHDPTELFRTLWSESSKRTVAEKSTWQSIRYIFVFPIQEFTDLLPWTLLLPFLLHKKSIAYIRENRFLRFSTVILVVNIIPYWLSPDTQARYVEMLYPLLFYLLAASFTYVTFPENKMQRSIPAIFITICVIGCLIYFPPMFSERTASVNNIYIICIGLCLLSILMLYAAIRQSAYLLYFTIAILLISRIGFNAIVLPIRYSEAPETQSRAWAKQIADITKNRELYLYDWSVINPNISYYIERDRNDILTYQWQPIEIDTSAFYIVSPHYVENASYNNYLEFSTQFENRTLYLIKFK